MTILPVSAIASVNDTAGEPEAQHVVHGFADLRVAPAEAEARAMPGRVSGTQLARHFP